jgi:hypothetical protein
VRKRGCREDKNYLPRFVFIYLFLGRTRWNTIDKDPEVAAANAKMCGEKFLAIWPNGWCSYYDASQGFDACYAQGICGVCEGGVVKVECS